MGKEKSHVLLKRHPVLCGMMLFRLRAQMQENGIAIANSWQSLPALLHLYNAANSEGFLRLPWGDLEGVILANTPERIFIGGRPKTVQEYQQRFLLILGCSASAFSGNRRSKEVIQSLQWSKRGRRKMLRTSNLAYLFHDLSAEEGPQENSNDENLPLKFMIERVLGGQGNISLSAKGKDDQEASGREATNSRWKSRQLERQRKAVDNITAPKFVGILAHLFEMVSLVSLFCLLRTYPYFIFYLFVECT